MSRLARLAATIAFALAYLSQPLALDACSVSCEAALAARTPAVAPSCHHTTSCATQISQPTSPGSTTATAVAAPPMTSVEVIEIAVVPGSHPYRVVPVATWPPIQLRM
jgi:hypothetical protein